MDSNDAVSAFSALSQQTRLDVLRMLIQAGPEGIPAGEIGDRLGIRQNTMSANLAILSQAGLVRTQREGRSIRYFADYGAISGLLMFLMQDCCGGRTELCQPVIDQMACGC